MSEKTIKFDSANPEKYAPTKIEGRIAQLLIQHNGNITYTAREYPSTRWNIYRHIKRSAFLQFVFENARAKLIDKAEYKLYEAIERGEAWAITLILKTLGKSRGYVERIEQRQVSEHRHTIEDWKAEADKKIKQLQAAADSRNKQE